MSQKQEIGALDTNEMNMGKPIGLTLRLAPGSNALVPIQEGESERYKVRVRTGKTTEATLFLFKESEKAGLLKNLSIKSIRLLFLTAARWPKLKGLSLEQLDTIRKDPFGKIAELAAYCNLSRKSCYKMITQLIKELWGAGYANANGKIIRYIDELEAKGNGEYDFLNGAFSMSFMQDFQSEAHTTIYPSRDILADWKLPDLAPILSIILTEDARIKWSFDPNLDLNSEIKMRIDTLFEQMNRPTKAPNRKDKEVILRPFIRALEALDQKGFFGETPYFMFERTQKISLDAAKKDGTTWKDILKCSLVWKPSFEPIPKDTRARALGHRKQATLLAMGTAGHTRKRGGKRNGTTKKAPLTGAWAGGISKGINPDEQ
jgi:hypothetical protein